MLGWSVRVYRKATDRSRPAAEDSPLSTRLAVWQSSVDGLDWIDELTETEDAVLLGQNGGYPFRFTARVSAVMPTILHGPPGARAVWLFDSGDIIDHSKWAGRTIIDEAAIADCDPNEWLLIEAWDES
jgi:hypothetical protein